jgi:hypothetical protein
MSEPEYERFESQPAPAYDEREVLADREREIYASKRVSRPAYTRPDPDGTVRVENVKPGYDKATFPIQRKNAIAKMAEDEVISPEGSLWRLQRLIADAKFDLLKQCVNSGVHMVSDIEAEIVVRVEARVLTDKAGIITRVKEGVDEVSILLPNGEFRFGGY